MSGAVETRVTDPTLLEYRATEQIETSTPFNFAIQYKLSCPKHIFYYNILIALIKEMVLLLLNKSISDLFLKINTGLWADVRATGRV